MDIAYLKQTNPSTDIIQLRSVSDQNISAKANSDMPSKNWWQRFIAFAAGQEQNRFGWLAAAITLQGCILAPLTLFAIVSTANLFVLWIPCILAFAVTEVVNLAAMSTKITIPVLFAGILIDIAVIVTSILVA